MVVRMRIPNNNDRMMAKGVRMDGSSEEDDDDGDIRDSEGEEGSGKSDSSKEDKIL
jgi:hypothetical protein